MAIYILDPIPIRREALSALLCSLGYKAPRHVGSLQEWRTTRTKEDVSESLTIVPLQSCHDIEATTSTLMHSTPPSNLIILGDTSSTVPASLIETITKNVNHQQYCGIGILALTPKNDTKMLESVIGTVMNGGVVIDKDAVAESTPDIINHKLTDREKEILELVAAGKTTQQISRKLCISAATVDKHTTAVFKKLGLANTDGNLRVLATRIYVSKCFKI